MALNWTMLNADRSPVPLPHELFIRTIESGPELTLLVPATPERKLKELGRLWLTDQRLVFVSSLPQAAASGTPPKPSFDSLTVPLPSILATKFEQPYFGPNFLSLDIRPSPDGGLTDGTKAEIRFKDKGLFEFVGILEKTRERAIYMRRQSADEEEGLPGYTSPAGPSGVSGSTPMPQDAPPDYDAPAYTP